MYKAEIHRTLERVQLLEELNLSVAITGEAYQSNHSIDGTVRIFKQADDKVISDREHPPRHLLEPLLEPFRDAIGDGSQSGGPSPYPSTRLFMGFAREKPFIYNKSTFQNEYVTESLEVQGVPENGVIDFDVDWTEETAKESVEKGAAQLQEKSYDVTGISAAQLPITIRGVLYHDARHLNQNIDIERDGGVNQLDGLAALGVEIEYCGDQTSSRSMHIEGFRLEIENPFPQAKFYPRPEATFNPETNHVEWASDSVNPGKETAYAIVGPIDELQEIESINATFRAEMNGRTISGMIISGLYDESGSQFDKHRDIVEEKIQITAEVTAEPTAVRVETREYTPSDQKVTSNERADSTNSELSAADVSTEEHHLVPTDIPQTPDVSVDYDAVRDEEVIGSGGNAEVTRATLPAPNREVTIALKRPQVTDTLHAEKIEQILDEAETWAKLDDNDYIVDVIDYGSEPVPWIAMEYMDAGHLGDIAGKMGHEQALWTAIAITRGVRHAHRRGVAHLDLKPQNVLFRSTEESQQWEIPKVGDWGLSKHLLDHSKSVEGYTPMYAAPEQLDDEYGPADDITDVYQLGAVFYELFTGRLPFQGDNTGQIIRNVLEKEPTPPSKFGNVPEELDTILLTALSKNKDERYDNAAYLRDALRSLYEDRINQ